MLLTNIVNKQTFKVLPKGRDPGYKLSIEGFFSNICVMKLFHESHWISLWHPWEPLEAIPWGRPRLCWGLNLFRGLKQFFCQALKTEFNIFSLIGCRMMWIINLLELNLCWFIKSNADYNGLSDCFPFLGSGSYK